MNRMLAATAMLLSISCGGPDPTVGTLSQNVGASFAPCSAAEIRFMATKHNFMTSFRPCGNNNFTQYRWSPSGKHLYFQLVMTPYIMDAEPAHKPTMAVPTQTPIGTGAWISDYRLAIPVGAGMESDASQLAVYDLEQQSIFHTNIDFTAVKEMQRTDDPGILLVLGTRNQTEGLWRLDINTGDASVAYDWLREVPDTFTYQPALDVVLIGHDNTVTLHQGSDGLAIGQWPALRGSLHPMGQYLMLEHAGEEVSIFYQRAWDELSEQARERELRRLERFEETLSDGTPKRIRPPTLSWVDLHTGQRWTMSSAYGDRFQWYEASPYYGAFFLWGFEGKQFKRNVMLGNFNIRFVSIDKGRTMMGVERFEAGEDPNYKPPTGAAPTDVKTDEAAVTEAPAKSTL